MTTEYYFGIICQAKGEITLRDIDVGETKGVVRRIDALNRLCIPKEFVKKLGMEADDEVQIFLTETGVFIKKAY